MRIFSWWRKRLSRNQRGFTVLELIIAIGIGGVLSAGTAGAIFQIGSINDLDNSRVIAVQQVENATHYIIRDAQMVRHPAAGTNAAFPLTLSWRTWEGNTTIQVVYTLNGNGNLVRQYSENGGTVTNQTVGKFISLDAAKTNWSYDSATRMMTVKISSSVTTGLKQADETRTVTIIPRSGS